MAQRRPNKVPSPRMRCRDLGEYRDCVVLIVGENRRVFLEHLRLHLRDAHGVTPVGFPRRRRIAEARLDRLSATKEPAR
jgi:hypothetical protein